MNLSDKQCRLEARNTATVADSCRRIEATEQIPTLAELAAAAGMSTFHFHRIFKAATGLTPRGYAQAHRARRVREELEHSNSVTEAIYQAGYQSNGRFYAEADDMLGMKPASFRAGGANTAIHFALGSCSLGAILVAASSRGVCCILLGDDPDVLIEDFQRRFAQAELVGADAGFERIVAQVVGLVEAPGLGLDLPLDVRGTAFQQRVWQALRGIPAGSTASYRDIAERIGSPKAVRAVAGACAANDLAIAIPCHRVVRTNGELSGYRWGVARKKILLEREQGTVLVDKN